MVLDVCLCDAFA
ncbi:hypothetical protein O1D83_003627 [Vibrio cholerae]|uniref:Uncharacterized protein n=1 Tax=Vibrio navarrensis TaxID=29495 RepID=A0AAI9GAF9_9VIBR|nr:hypothetical protein [Vibrio cholerae]EGR2798130.1 hypothetical protein [Vibrio navarrensis]EGR0744231.1 hypothetical protein [Vibrio cholerae]EGR0757259.1 hypothetical protein [Vibrio cholerae]EGR0820817.1 hypothetical protein [Vibrio cholerae]